ncbi:MAG: hypothetical protein ACR2Q4_15830 [Geminicoccaceae bacterium]
MFDRRAMFAHGMPMVQTTSPDQVSEACHRDAQERHADAGDIPCPACGDRLHYRFRLNASAQTGAIYAHCVRTGCIAILG